MIISTHREAVEFQRQELKNVAIFVVAIIAVIACFAFVSNADYADEERREQATADLACRSAGADHAVRVEAESRSIYICDQPRRDS